MPNIKLPILERKQIAEGTWEISFGRKESDKNNFKAGQYFRFILPKLYIDDPRGNSREFSIASSPANTKIVQIAFRQSDSNYKKTLLRLPVGTQITLDGPHGIFILPQDKKTPVVFIAGGIGITPFLSMLRECAEKKSGRRITLLYINHSKERTAYLAELNNLRQSLPKFTLIDHIGRPDNDFFAKVLDANKDAMWYVAGADRMIIDTLGKLQKIGVPEANVKTEIFTYNLPTTTTTTTTTTTSLVFSKESSEAILQGLNEAALVSVTDAYGTITYTNDKFLEVSKYSRKELLGNNHRILKSGYHPQSFYNDMWHNYLLQGKIFRGEIKNKAKDGSFYWVDANISPIRDTSGKTVGYVGIRFSITERKKIEEKLQDSERRLRLNVENTPVAIIEWDKDFQVASWNPSAERIFGYTKEEAMGKHANFIIPEDVRPFVDDVWKKLLAGKITQVTNDNIAKDGKRIVCEWHNTPLVSSSGEVFGATSMLLDVTERVKLEESMLLLSSLVKQTTQAWSMSDLKGNMVDANDAFMRLLGYSKEELLKMEYPFLIDSADREKVVMGTQQIIQTKQPFAANVRFIKKDGSKIIIALTINVYFKNDRPKYLYAFLTDITKQQQIIEDLEKMNRLMVGRELKMIELKKEIEWLKKSVK